MQRKILLAVFILLNYAAPAQDEALNYLRPVVKNIKLSTGVNLEYAEQGDVTGTPVILLHGYTESRLSYQQVLPLLPGNLHVFAISQRGHGNSSKYGSDYLPKDFAADLATFISQKKLHSAIIVGHSMGGIIAQQFALDYPQLTKALVIIDSNAGSEANPGLEEFIKEVSRLMDPVSAQFAESFLKGTVAKTVDTAFYKLQVAETMKVPAAVWKAAMKGLVSVNYRSVLHNIYQPTLILWGDKDFITTKNEQDILAAGIKNSKLVVYEGTGHALHWEEPGRFVKDLVAFIDDAVSK
jgi:pimeloyl-ACP methyl ester carboxylesterase